MKDIPGTGDIRVQGVHGLSLLRIYANYNFIDRHGECASEILRTVEMLRAGT